MTRDQFTNKIIHTHLGGYATGASLSQTPLPIHTHHPCPIPTCRVVTHGPSQVILRDMFSNLPLQLHLNARISESLATCWTHWPVSLGIRTGERRSLSRIPYVITSLTIVDWSKVCLRFTVSTWINWLEWKRWRSRVIPIN